MMKSMKGSLKMLSDITPPELSQKSDRVCSIYKSLIIYCVTDV